MGQADIHGISERQGWIAATVAISLLAALVIVDHLLGASFNPSIAYPTLLLACWWVRSRRFVWLLTLLAFIGSVAVAGMEIHAESYSSAELGRVIAHRTLALTAMLITAGVFHHLLGSWNSLRGTTEQLAQHREELQRSVADLAAREQDIAAQNEELSRQTEELERRGEELRVANDELARRQRTLESLLRLSRSLTAEMSRQDTLGRICQALGEMVNVPHVGVGVKLLQGKELRLACHHGFGPQGPAREVFDFAGSFARLVIERNRIGYLDDATLRPDVTIPQPKEGDAFLSILAAPLRVNGHAIGALEVYGRERRSWSKEEMAMVESLAAQTSISLQAAELFERIGRERERLRAVLETIPIGIAIANHNASDIRLNPTCAAMFGSPADENAALAAFRRTFRMFRQGVEIGDADRPLIRACRGEIIHAEEIELVYPDGRHLSITTHAAPIHGSDGKIAGAVVAFVDITRHKQLQQELDSRRRSAEEASSRKSRFLAQASHDIRNPVNAIGLLAELLLRAASGPAMAHEVPSIATDLRKNAVSLVELVSDVLDLTRFDSGRIELDEAEFCLNDLLADECRTYQQVAGEKQLELECQIPQEPIHVRTDRVKLSRVLGNLLSNAVKFTKKGKVALSAGNHADGRIWIRVHDTGHGIPPEHHQRIFDEFFQLSRTTGNRGAGLGLAICKRLIEAMGGSISVESQPDNGSTFTITLPPNTVICR